MYLIQSMHFSLLIIIEQVKAEWVYYSRFEITHLFM